MKLLIQTAILALTGLASVQAGEVNARFGINLGELTDWNRQQPFVNVMKTSRSWISQSQEKWDMQEPLVLDAQDYVKELAPGQWAATLMLTDVGPSFPGGEYVLLYEGEGEFEWKGSARSVSIEPGREVVNVDPGSAEFVHMILKSVNPSNYPRNMRFVRKDLEAVSGKEIFTPEFLALWKLADTFRFMDWAHTNPSKQSRWQDRPLPQNRTYSKTGAAWEDMIALCNQSGTNAWVNVPHLADDDYIRQLAVLCRDTLKPGLKVYFEFSNEVWNGMFPATRYAEEQGLKAGLAPEKWKAGLLFHAQECVRMYKILDEVFVGAPEGRYVKVIATQAANQGVAKVVVGAPGVAEGADVLAVAPYLTFNVPVNASQWDAGMPVAADVENWSLDQLFDYLQNKSLPQCQRWMDEQMQLATEHKLGLVAYEGGQHLTALGEANRNKKLVDLLNQANRDPRMGGLYTAYLDHWTQIGGGLFCLFNDAGRYTNSGAWGLLEFWGQGAASSPKYAAVLKWAESLPGK